MDDKKGRDWLLKRAKEWQGYEGNKKPIAHYMDRVQKLMIESDNKKADKKGKRK